MRGQYSSAMEHAVPEEFWVDKSTCRYTENGQVKNPNLQPCAEGISAVKAIAIAQQQGQKIYTINRDNAATALPKLPVGGDAGVEIRSAIQAGKEVTVHESRISAHGWTGYGYTIVDPETGAGAYLIEGKGNGAILISAGIAIFALATFISLSGVGIVVASAAVVLALALVAAGISLLLGNSDLCRNILSNASAAFLGVLAGVGVNAALLSLFGSSVASAPFYGILAGLLAAIGVTAADSGFGLFGVCRA